ncbi:hypothetical protein FB559_3159 [Actinoallomurus bryophytorum]|uniref:Uncharacterized protein n=1 Tax=Actinoallomurus bryophytorum TaxID=1490222 RepID=A0A543CKG7_9ACTN|nr:hypothetical protein [Actinoallomurus bryophytorum]TQL97565.1 hypothetical protein FB559_3159 [Actinoallomurus bryophytorum]
MTRDPARYEDRQDVRWDLVAYSAQDDHLCGEFPVTREQFIRVRELFDFSDEAFPDCYPVRPELWPQVITILACPPLEPDKEYFIEVTATDY